MDFVNLGTEGRLVSKLMYFTVGLIVVPLEGCGIGRISQLNLRHQRFELVDVLLGNRLVNQDSAVGLAMLATVVVNGIMRP